LGNVTRLAAAAGRTAAAHRLAGRRRRAVHARAVWRVLFLTVLALSLYAIPKSVALSYSVLLHLTTYAPVLALGAYCLWRDKITWHKLEEAARRLENRLGQAGVSRRE
jgi:hypothetical protein